MTNRIFHIIGLLAALLAWLMGSAQPALAQQQLIPLKVSLGDVDITKIPVVIAYEEGIFKKNGLDAQVFISKSAADSIKEQSGIYPPSQYVGGEAAPISIGGGAPLVYSRVYTALSADSKSAFHVSLN